MDDDCDVYTLSIAASAEHVSTARLFAAATARHLGAGEDGVEDLRLAITEACTMALQSATSSSALVVSIRPVAGGVATHIRTNPAQETPPGSPEGSVADDTDHPDEHHEAVAGWGTDLLEAMVSDMSVGPEPDGPFELSFVCALDRDASPNDRA